MLNSLHNNYPIIITPGETPPASKQCNDYTSHLNSQYDDKRCNNSVSKLNSPHANNNAIILSVCQCPLKQIVSFCCNTAIASIMSIEIVSKNGLLVLRCNTTTLITHQVHLLKPPQLDRQKSCPAVPALSAYPWTWWSPKCGPNCHTGTYSPVGKVATGAGK